MQMGVPCTIYIVNVIALCYVMASLPEVSWYPLPDHRPSFIFFLYIFKVILGWRPFHPCLFFSFSPTSDGD